MAYLRMQKFVKNKPQHKPAPVVNTKQTSWVVQQPVNSIAARLTKEQRDAVLIAELRYLEEEIAWQAGERRA